jgi:phosphoserine phosphatase
MSLHVFDMDGTLLKGTTASLQIARHLGCTRELAGLEARFAAGEIDTRGFDVRRSAFPLADQYSGGERRSQPR